jgi:hypothetical protein
MNQSKPRINEESNRAETLLQVFENCGRLSRDDIRWLCEQVIKSAPAAQLPAQVAGGRDASFHHGITQTDAFNISQAPAAPEHSIEPPAAPVEARSTPNECMHGVEPEDSCLKCHPSLLRFNENEAFPPAAVTPTQMDGCEQLAFELRDKDLIGSYASDIPDVTVRRWSKRIAAWHTASLAKAREEARSAALEEAAKQVERWSFMACSDADGLAAEIRALRLTAPGRETK